MARVLLVDDEPSLLFTLSQLVKSRGHESVLAQSAEEALGKLEGVDSVVSDYSMPGMDGEEMIAKMRLRAPKLRVIVASGYPYEPRGKRTGFLLKPFLPKMLAEEIERLLQA